MRLLYNIGIQLYLLFIRIASLFNKKAALWLEGRKDCSLIRCSGSIWFHFASLGEFEQGRPVLERIKEQYPGDKIVITFFSPSGYEVRKHTPLADYVYYLPLDTQKKAVEFIETINPKFAVFTKYEYWYHFFNESHKRGIPLYIVSGIFRPQQLFFKWYGSLHREILSFVTYFFVQDDRSKQLLAELRLSNVTVSGDTRFDRVWSNAQHPKLLPEIAAFKGDKKLFIAGSTWLPDEKLIGRLVTDYPGWKFLIAPHEINEEKIGALLDLLPEHSAIRYSQMGSNPTGERQTLIIDNIGMLSSLYQYGDIAYVGGGFGAGIHNTLEAATFGIPVIFGPNYAKFIEARDLVDMSSGFSINNGDELKEITSQLVKDTDFYTAACKKNRDYVAAHTGATETIVNYINRQNNPKKTI